MTSFKMEAEKSVSGDSVIKQPKAAVHPTAIIAEGASVAENVFIGPYCVIGAGVTLGEGTHLQSHVVIEGNTTLGKNNRVYPFASLGQDPQDLKFKGENTTLEIGDNNTIREHVTLNVGTEGGGSRTVIGNDNLLMGSVHLGHDCIIGNDNVLAQSATLGGHVIIGNNCVIGGMSAIHQFVHIGNYVIVGGLTPVVKDVIPYGAVEGERAKLAGLNLRGLRRNGFKRDEIRNIQTLYQEIFAGEGGTLESRAAYMAEEMSDVPQAKEFYDFIKNASKRGVCTP